MGTGGKGAGAASGAAGQQAAIANQLFQETGPLRGLLFGTPGTPATAGIPGGWSFGREGDINPPREAGPQWLPGTPGQPAGAGRPGLIEGVLTGPNVFPAERDVLERQFSRARENIISAGPARGGLQSSLLAANEAERAFGVTGLESMGQQRRQENIFRTAGLTTGQAGVSLAGLGSSGNIYSGLAGQQAGLAGQLGQAAGLAVGMRGLGKAGTTAKGPAAILTGL